MTNMPTPIEKPSPFRDLRPATQTAMKINMIDPGAVRTKMRADAYPGEDPATLRTPDSITDLFVELCAPECERHGDVLRAY